MLFKNTNQYFTTFGYNFYLEDFLFKNQFLAQIIEGIPISYIFSTKVIFKNYISLSLHYQPKYLTGGEIGIYLPGNLKIAYGMDISNTKESVSMIIIIDFQFHFKFSEVKVTGQIDRNLTNLIL